MRQNKKFSWNILIILIFILLFNYELIYKFTL